MSIEAMKLWLKALETSWYHVGTFCPTDAAIELYDEARDSLRQAIEQAQKQEPSLWFAIHKDGNVKYTTDRARAKGWAESDSYRVVRDYYTSPPQRQPLTTMEVYDAVHEADLDWHTGFALGEDENRFVVFARAIEAAHGIKGKA